MKRVNKTRIIIWLAVLTVLTVFGGVFSFLKWNDYKKTIQSVEYLDIALSSMEDAYQLLMKTNFYKNLFIGLSIAAGCSLIALAVFILIQRLKRTKEEKIILPAEEIQNSNEFAAVTVVNEDIPEDGKYQENVEKM
jgi:ABC-type Fe3+ transport system permease subunit